MSCVISFAREPVPAAVLKAYQLKKLKFGPDYILPKPFDPRLAQRVPQAVAKAVSRKTPKRAVKKAKAPVGRR
jgi:malate dehydrogenase (oxaloacetate-decarboxylating)(NADP+)